MNSSNIEFKVLPKPFDKVVEVPSSKSYANRMLILAALNPRPVIVKNISQSSDVLNLISALEKVGVKINKRGTEIEILNSFPACEEKTSGNEVLVETGDGGTTTRFLIPFLSLGKKNYQVEPEGGMRQRPMTELLEALKKMGARIESGKEKFWLKVQGPIDLKTSVEIDCSRSTQFASALALVLKDHPDSLILKNLSASVDYFYLTQSLVKRGDDLLFNVPVDMSSFSYPAALAAVCGRVKINSVKGMDPYQPDSILIEVLKNIGVEVIQHQDFIEINGGHALSPFSLNCSGFPDLVPTLAYLASFCDGVSTLSGLEVLKHKESDRLYEIKKLLSHFGIEFKNSSDDLLEIKGASLKKRKLNLRPQRYVPAPDHRIVMVTYLFMRTFVGGVLGNSQHVRKSYPDFFKVMC